MYQTNHGCAEKSGWLSVTYLITKMKKYDVIIGYNKYSLCVYILSEKVKFAKLCLEILIADKLLKY